MTLWVGDRRLKDADSAKEKQPSTGVLKKGERKVEVWSKVRKAVLLRKLEITIDLKGGAFIPKQC